MGENQAFANRVFPPLSSQFSIIKRKILNPDLLCFGDLDFKKHSKSGYHTSDKAGFKMILVNRYVNM